MTEQEAIYLVGSTVAALISVIVAWEAVKKLRAKSLAPTVFFAILAIIFGLVPGMTAWNTLNHGLDVAHATHIYMGVPENHTALLPTLVGFAYMVAYGLAALAMSIMIPAMIIGGFIYGMRALIRA